MDRRIITVALTILLCASTALGRMNALVVGGGGSGQQADYTPSAVSVKFGTNSTSGNNIKISIYTSGRNLLCTSSIIAKSAGSTVNGSISGCGALTPGATYYVSWVGDGYVPMSYETSPTYVTSYIQSTGSYATPVSTLAAGDGLNIGEAAISVSNASSQRLLGDPDFTDNTNVANNGLTSDRIGFFNAGYTCTTL